jgi:predicted RNase H-like HicB family nuclease
MTYAVIFEKGPTSWGAYVPDLPGVISVAHSRDEVKQLIQEAIEFHLQGMREEGLPIPAPSSFAGSRSRSRRLIGQRIAFSGFGKLKRKPAVERRFAYEENPAITLRSRR